MKTTRIIPVLSLSILCLSLGSAFAGDKPAKQNITVSTAADPSKPTEVNVNIDSVNKKAEGLTSEQMQKLVGGYSKINLLKNDLVVLTQIDGVRHQFGTKSSSSDILASLKKVDLEKCTAEVTITSSASDSILTISIVNGNGESIMHWQEPHVTIHAVAYAPVAKTLGDKG